MGFWPKGVPIGSQCLVAKGKRRKGRDTVRTCSSGAVRLRRGDLQHTMDCRSEGSQPSLAVRPLGANPHTCVPPPGAMFQEACTLSHQQALEGPPEPPVPTVNGDRGSEYARACGALRRGCFPFQCGYFWLCSCSHCGNCTCPVQCGNMASFPRKMYTEQAARKLLVGCECLPACLPTHPTSPSPLSLPLS